MSGIYKAAAWAAYMLLWSLAGLYLVPDLQYLGEFLLFVSAALVTPRLKNLWHEPVALCILLLLAMHVLRMALNVAQGAGFSDVLRNGHRVFLYLVPLVFALVLNARGDIQRAIDVSAAMVFVAALSYLIVRIGVADLGYVTEIDPESGAPRVRHIVFELMFVFGILLLASGLVIANPVRRLVYLAHYVAALAVIVDSYFRSLLLAFLFCSTVALIGLGAKGRNAARTLATVTGVVMIGAIVALTSGNAALITQRLGSLAGEIESQAGTFLSRVIIWQVRYDAATEGGKTAFGFGFVAAKTDDDATVEDRILDPLIMDNDNGYASVLVAYGYFGFVVFGILYAVTLVDSIRTFNRSQGLMAALSITVAAVSMSNLLVSFFRDFFLWLYSVLAFGFILGVYLAAKRHTFDARPSPSAATVRPTRPGP